MIKEQIPLEEKDVAEWEKMDDGTKEILPDLAYKRIVMVNVVFVGPAGAGDRQWVLIDTGLPVTIGMIRRAARERFGEGSRPAAIIMTHGHFDHVGGLEKLAEEWDVPVYAHKLEQPYLNGSMAYPPPDPLVGGLMALSSPLLPRGPVNVGHRLRVLLDDHTVPFMLGWKWLHTPGHTPGHVSLWRDADRTLISGDAVITTRQESVYAVAVQTPEMHGPPQYFTPDWPAAAASSRVLAKLEPELIVSGHGQAMKGSDMRQALHTLADHFEQVAIPDAKK